MNIPFISFFVECIFCKTMIDKYIITGYDIILGYVIVYLLMRCRSVHVDRLKYLIIVKTPMFKY